MAWILFNLFVLGMLAVDLGVFHRNSHEVKLKEALSWSVVWFVLAMLFNVGVYHWLGSKAALEFFTGYLIEKSLSVDNIFIFIMLFSFFSVPRQYQHKVLFWGILGALIMRAVLIATGTALLAKFHWVIYLFGAFLAFTGVKMLTAKDTQFDPEKSLPIRALKRFIPVTADFIGDRFFVRKDGRLWATPLFVVLFVIETTDLLFAIDSIPAIFAVTTDPFIVYTSNVFAILGLRSLYFALAGVMDKFRYLKVGLAFVLMFVGAKMIAMGWIKIPVAVSLGAIATILGTAIGFSLWCAPKTDYRLDSK